MKIFLTDQAHSFPQHLKRLCRIPVMRYEQNRLKEQVSAIEVSVGLPFQDIDFSFFFDYHIFPANIMAALGQWQQENKAMAIGDTILQQVFIPPFKLCSQKIIFGVRISAIIDEPDRKGFSYETLVGHVEKGISTFVIEMADEGKVSFTIHTYSEPGTLLAKLLGPIFSVPYQKYCTKSALENVKQRLQKM